MEILSKIQTFIWGPQTLILLMGTGLYFTIRLKGLQITKFTRAFRAIFEKEEGTGDVSPFATLCTTMAADIGTGSIVGVATALRIGGAGAMFWMWISALLGMTIKYAESVLAVKYRVTDEKDQMAGGPMYYIQNGLGKKYIWLAKVFSFCGVFTALLGCGTFPQVNAIVESTNQAFHIPVLIVGAVITILVAVVIVGGIQSISKVAEFVVPFMAISFVMLSVMGLIVNREKVPEAMGLIFRSAFSVKSAAGGAAGAGAVSIITIIRTGVARGVYTNEAGLGSSPIVAAAAKTNSCVKQGLVSMTSVFVTTLVICTMTGLVIISSGYLQSTADSGTVLVNEAYNLILPGQLGMYVVTFGIICFSFTTILGWSYYGERCVLYLTGKMQMIKVFKVMYVLAIALAPVLSLDAIWLLADITNALMIIPNLIALIGLRKVVIKETEEFFRKEDISGKSYSVHMRKTREHGA